MHIHATAANAELGREARLSSVEADLTAVAELASGAARASRVFDRD